MNSLSLRVSAIKTTENTKKNSEIRLSAISLPNTRLFATACHSKQCEEGFELELFETFKKEYTNADSIEPQLLALRKITSRIIDECSSSNDNELFVQAITDIYFYATLKHPVRNTLAKILHTTHHRKDQIVRCLLNSMRESNEHIAFILTKEPSIYTINDYINSFTGCFENFPEANAAMEHCFFDLLLNINQIITVYLNILKATDKLSPAKRSEIYIFLHNAIRVALSVVQNYQTKDTKKETLAHILEQSWGCLIERDEFTDVPMDTKVNCGILKAFYDRIFSDIYADAEGLIAGQDVCFVDDAPSYEPETIKQLCYHIALINTIADNDFQNKNFFPSINLIVLKLTRFAKIYTMDSCILMALSRALVQLSKKILVLFRQSSTDLSDTENGIVIEIIQHCLNCVWINVDNSGDSVRHQAKELLKNLLKLAHQFPNQFDFILENVLTIARSTETSETLVCLLLDYLCQVFNSKRVLEEIPDLQSRILANIFKEPSWSACYERLMISNSSDEKLEIWCENWLRPLLRINEFEWHSNFDRLKIIRNLFEKSMKAKPEAAEYILNHPDLSLEIYLFVLWTMRKSGRKSYSPTCWTPSTDKKVVAAKFNPNDEIRILAFRILIECHKTTEIFPACDLNEILEFFRLNCNCQNPSIRQQINTSIKKALSRLEAGHVIIAKTDTDESRTISNNYRSFISKLIEFCGDECLFEGANFSRRTTALATLLYAITTWNQLWPENHAVITKRLLHRLLKIHSDSYVSNRALANQILRLCPKHKLNGVDASMLYDEKQVARLATSIRPDDSVTAAYYLEYCVFSQTHFKSIYDAVIWCENLLDEGLATAKVSLLIAARINPMYGLLLCIRHLLAQVNFMKTKETEEIQMWRTFFKRFIPKCVALTDVIAPIVNSSAPEGHLPNDFSNIDHFIATENHEDFLDECENNEDRKDVKVTPQVMLICAWRTVREVSLLLGDITLRTPVISTLSHSQNGLITVDDLLDIGLHFQQLLAETKHRGAFEQAYVGFSKLCIRLWRANEPELHCRPMQWIRELMAIIDDEPDETVMANTKLCVTKLCATRRSAGVPFMVQALITSEFQVCSSTGLNYCMKHLIGICKNGKRMESRTHALNILRALFRCTELGAAISEYISDGIECSIRGYGASTWPERNSSTLLFASLMTRIFGVQRSRESDNLNIRNKMTGRIFFIRYPQLYDFFLSELKYSSEAIAHNDRPIRLHPLLLLISRLYPSALEGSESNLKLSTFIPLISSCSSSPELATRNLSAKSLVALIPPGNVIDSVFDILNKLENSSNLSSNSVHGYLLQILYLLRSTKSHTHRIPQDILLKFCKAYIQYELNNSGPGHSILQKVYIEVLLQIFITCQLEASNEELLAMLLKLYTKFVNNFQNSIGYNQLTQSYLRKSFTIFELLVSQFFPISQTISSCKTYEEIETNLNVLVLILCQKHHIGYEKQDFSQLEIDFVTYYLNQNNDKLDTIERHLPDSKDLYFIAEKRNIFYPFGTIKAYTALSILINSQASIVWNDITVFKLINRKTILLLMKSVSNDTEIDDVAAATWKFINSILASGKVDLQNATENELSEIILYLRQISLSHKMPALRATAVDALSIIHGHMLRQPISQRLLIKFSELVLILLRDDSVSVRNRMSDLVFDITHGTVNGAVNRAIPIVAENIFLKWLDTKFGMIEPNAAWVLWKELVDTFELKKNNEENDNCESNINDVPTGALDEIFDANEANIFGEGFLACFKCYEYLLQRISNSTSLSSTQIEMLRTTVAFDYPILSNFK